MQQANKPAESKFGSLPGQFLGGGLLGSSIAILVSFIEAAASHTVERSANGDARHDGAAEIPSPFASTADIAVVTSQATNGSPLPEQVATRSPGQDQAHEPSDQAQSINNHQTGDQAEHYIYDARAHSATAPAAAISDAAPTDVGNGSSPIPVTSDSFWFNADGPVHVALGADDGAQATGHDFASLFDAFADNSTANAEIVFTGAESSSFNYSGPSILDTAPGGAHSNSAGAFGVADANFASMDLASHGSDFSARQSAGIIQNDLSFAAGLAAKADAPSTLAAPTGLGAPVLQVWNGDIGSGYTTAGSGSGTTGGSGIAGAVSSSNGSGLVINVIYDASVANAPAGFTQAVAAVVNYYENTFSNPVTVTIDVGYGEIDGQALEPFALGESEGYLTSVSYSQLCAALVANANAIGDSAAAASLPTTSPTSGQYWITTAEAHALGISTAANSLDGYAGFSNLSNLFDFNTTNNAGTPPSNLYDFFGVVAHEFSEIMGRQVMDGQTFVGSAAYEALDLFHYSSPGIHDFSGTTPGYASPNGGFTNLGNFNTNPNGDFGDWSSSAGSNSFLATSYPGAINPVTASDITLMNLLGWDSNTSPPTNSTPPSTVIAPPTAGYVTQGGATSVSAGGGVLADASDTNPSNHLTVTTVDGLAGNVGVGVAGNFGVMTLNADGSYAYVNNNPGGVSAMGGVAEDSFNFSVSDSQGSTSYSTLTVLVTSADETLVTGPTNTTIEAGRGPAVIDAGAGNMTAVAGSAHQTLFGGPGDTLWGANRGHDTFLFAPNFGKETIETFKSSDVIEFPTSVFANFHQVEDSMQTIGHQTVITYDATDTITLAHFAAAHLHASNFSFIV